MELERGIVMSFAPAYGYGWVKIGDLELPITDEDGWIFANSPDGPQLTETRDGRLPKRNDQVMCEVDRNRPERILRWGYADEHDRLVQLAGAPSEFQGGKEAGGVGPGSFVF